MFLREISIQTLINNSFNNHVNPKIIQRKARHRKIETTLRYDHVSDDMVREYFEELSMNLTSKESKITDNSNKEICYI